MHIFLPAYFQRMRSGFKQRRIICATIKLRDYALGAWESLNYVIRFLDKNNKEDAVKEFKSLKEELEEGVSVDFQRKLTTM